MTLGTVTNNNPSYQPTPAKQASKGSSSWGFILLIVGLIGSAVIYKIDFKQ